MVSEKFMNFSMKLGEYIFVLKDWRWGGIHSSDMFVRLTSQVAWSPVIHGPCVNTIIFLPWRSFLQVNLGCCKWMIIWFKVLEHLKSSHLLHFTVVRPSPSFGSKSSSLRSFYSSSLHISEAYISGWVALYHLCFFCTFGFHGVGGLTIYCMWLGEHSIQHCIVVVVVPSLLSISFLNFN